MRRFYLCALAFLVFLTVSRGAAATVDASVVAQTPITATTVATSTNSPGVTCVICAPAAADTGQPSQPNGLFSDWSSLLAALVGAVFGGLFVLLGDLVRARRERNEARMVAAARARALIDRAIAEALRAAELKRPMDLTLFDPFYSDAGQLYAETMRMRLAAGLTELWDKAAEYNALRETSPDVRAQELRAAAEQLRDLAAAQK